MIQKNGTPTRQHVSSGSPYEDKIGFCRAIRTGNIIFVAATGPITPDGRTVSPGDPYGQTKRCLEIIKEAIEGLGGKLEHVVRTRLMITDAGFWEDAGRAHSEFFATIRPVSTMVVVKGFVRDDLLVEIEADAVVEP